MHNSSGNKRKVLWLHKNYRQPAIPIEKVSKENLKLLKKPKKAVDSTHFGDDQMYIIDGKVCIMCVW